MRFRKRSSPVSDSGAAGNVDKVEEERPDSSGQATGAADSLARAEEAEAQAAEAEAAAEAARARAHAIRMRQQADAAAASDAEATESPQDEPTDTEATSDQATEEVSATPSEATSESGAVDTAEEADQPDTTEEAGDAEDDEAVAAEKQPRSKSRRSALKVVAATVTVIVICGLLALSGYFIWHHQGALDREQQAAKFEAAARQGVVTLMSLNFDTAQEDVQRIIDNSTGDFRKEFEKQAENFTKVAKQAKVVTEADVHSTAVKSMEEDTAVVLVAASSTVSNESGANQDPRPWRLAITMARDGDQIKMSKVEFVP